VTRNAAGENLARLLLPVPPTGAAAPDGAHA
jgi:hypothetical protein